VCVCVCVCVRACIIGSSGQCAQALGICKQISYVVPPLGLKLAFSTGLCMSTHTHTHMAHTYIHLQTKTHTACVRVCIPAMSVCSWVRASEPSEGPNSLYVYTHTHTHTHTHTRVCVCVTCVSLCVCVCVCVCEGRMHAFSTHNVFRCACA